MFVRKQADLYEEKVKQLEKSSKKYEISQEKLKDDPLLKPTAQTKNIAFVALDVSILLVSLTSENFQTSFLNLGTYFSDHSDFSQISTTYVVVRTRIQHLHYVIWNLFYFSSGFFNIGDLF